MTADAEPADLLTQILTVNPGQPVEYVAPTDPKARQMIDAYRDALDQELRASEAAHAAAAAGLQDLSAG